MKLTRNVVTAKNQNALAWDTIPSTRMIVIQVFSLHPSAARHHQNPVRYYRLYHPMHIRLIKLVVVHTSSNYLIP